MIYQQMDLYQMQEQSNIINILEQILYVHKQRMDTKPFQVRDEQYRQNWHQQKYQHQCH